MAMATSAPMPPKIGPKITPEEEEPEYEYEVVEDEEQVQSEDVMPPEM